MTPVPRPTAKEVVEAIDHGVFLMQQAYRPEEEPLYAANLERWIRALVSWRASLLEKGGPDAPVDQQEHAPRAVVGADRSSVLVSDQPNVARTLERQASPPLEKGARLPVSGLKWALGVLLRACPKPARLYPEGAGAPEREVIDYLVALMAERGGDNTPGGRT